MPVAVASEYIEAVAHLPLGTKLLAEDVTWKEYEQLLSELGPSYSVRVTASTAPVVLARAV